MESSLGCSRGQRVFGPAHRLGQWQRVEVSEGGTPADVTAVQRPPFTPRMCCYEMMTTAACHPRVEGGLLVVLEWPRMRDHGAEKRRPSQGGQFGTCNWDRSAFRPRSSARGLAGMKTAVSVSRASADTHRDASTSDCARVHGAAPVVTRLQCYPIYKKPGTGGCGAVS